MQTAWCALISSYGGVPLVGREHAWTRLFRATRAFRFQRKSRHFFRSTNLSGAAIALGIFLGIKKSGGHVGEFYYPHQLKLKGDSLYSNFALRFFNNFFDEGILLVIFL